MTCRFQALPPAISHRRRKATNRRPQVGFFPQQLGWDVASYNKVDFLWDGSKPVIRAEAPPSSTVRKTVEQVRHAVPEQGLLSAPPRRRLVGFYDVDSELPVVSSMPPEDTSSTEEEDHTSCALDGISGHVAATTPDTSTSSLSLSQSPPVTGYDDSGSDTSDHSAYYAMNRPPLPRIYGYVGFTEKDGCIIDAGAASRRLYSATEGRGMAALKRRSNGKRRSRVMVRSKINKGTIGWAHVLPPFSKTFVGVNELVGATRASRSVTVTFKSRGPVSEITI